jgi:uridine kinase
MFVSKAIEMALDMRQTVPPQLPVMIAIDGFGGAGKSEIAHKLFLELENSHVVGMDEFIRKEFLSSQGWFSGVFDHERLINTVLDPCRRGNSFMYQALIWSLDKLGSNQAILDVDYVIVEGITAASMRLQPYFDLRFWVDTPLEVATARGMKRDGDTQTPEQWALWAENDREYFDYERPDLSVDLKIQND